MPNIVNLVKFSADAPEEVIDQVYEKILVVRDVPLGDNHPAPFNASVHKGMPTIHSSNISKSGVNTEASLTFDLDAIPQKEFVFDFSSLLPIPEALKNIAGLDSDIADYLYEFQKRLPEMVLLAIEKARNGDDLFFSISKEGIENECRSYVVVLEKLRAKYQQPLNESSADSVYPRLNYAKLKVQALGAIAQSNLAPQPFMIKNLPNYLIPTDAEKAWVTKQIKNEIRTMHRDPESIVDLTYYLGIPMVQKRIDWGRVRAENIAKYGYADWRDWQKAAWGCNHSPRDLKVDWESRTMSFTTCPSCPKGIVKALADIVPHVDFEWIYADESCGGIAGHIWVLEGKLYAEEYAPRSQQAYNVHIECCGPSDCLFQDKNGNWHEHDCHMQIFN